MPLGFCLKCCDNNGEFDGSVQISYPTPNRALSKSKESSINDLVVKAPKSAQPAVKPKPVFENVLDELRSKFGDVELNDRSPNWPRKVLKPIEAKQPLPKAISNTFITVKLKPTGLLKLSRRPTKESQSPRMTNVVPSIGKPAPSFKGNAVVGGEFKEISLEDYEGKYVVLFFYPLDFTFVCPTEIIAFSDRVEEFRSIGCEVIACSTDSHFSHLAWVNTDRKQGGLGNMEIPLLADKNLEISKSFGVLKEEDGIAYRGLFIIDGKQNLRQVTINDLPVGRDVDETLRLVQAFQFTDEHGEVCPAGWKPGSKSMKADPKLSKEYFESEN